MTQVRFGAAAVKSRLSRSPARLPSLAGIVVRMPLDRRIPCRPRDFIARSTDPGDAFGQRPAHQRGHLPPPIQPFRGQPPAAVLIDGSRPAARTLSSTMASLTVRAATGLLG